MRDIAADLGLSTMTVSRALRSHPDTSEETRRRVLDYAEKLNFRPNRWAQSLARNKSYIVGVVVPEISHTYFAEIVMGVETVLDSAGYDLLLCHSRRDPVRERRELDMLIETRVDGLIIASAEPMEAAGSFEDLEESGPPIVLIDRVFEGSSMPAVRVDDLAVGRMSAEHLIELGHRRIGYVCWGELSVSQLRLQGFREALDEAGIAFDDRWLIRASLSEAECIPGVREMLSARDRPTAIGTTTDPSAVGVVRAAHEAGLRVPEDLSVMGAGDIEGDRQALPFLSTIAWSTDEMGRSAASSLLSMVSEGMKRQPPSELLKPELKARLSAGPPPK